MGWVIQGWDEVGHTRVGLGGLVMLGWGWSCRGGVGHTGVGWGGLCSKKT